ncbi:flagellar motor protein MotB (plasmid) [Arthrobacter sp. ERGS1:01]|uniref:OmpA/MotB family protein n=1 Tax=Arthrobacter sp. ERGS1:01 TaxID=1704044 RepID=UPI0006B49FD9|nr:flagellar motor protein MotB [Arthrobacter sp. ERGS1:01]ALE04211.1 flagellar motor protein MotB [Arthrobacter sp. ERGS1:01]
MSGSGRRGRKRRGKPADSHPDERWMASYMDMVTVLMCMFIVLYAMSTVDQDKFVKLRDSFATGYGQVQVGKVDTASGIVVPPKDVGKKGALSKSPYDLAVAEVNKLSALQETMRKRLDEKGLSANVAFQIDQRGLSVKLVGSQSFFQPDSPALSDRATEVLNVIGPVLVASGLEVSVEGHAANAITNYPSVWELSAERAVGVVRYLVEHRKMPEGKIGAIGYGSSRSVNDNSTEALRELNRRVDIVVLSNQPDQVRALIPDALKARTASS